MGLDIACSESVLYSSKNFVRPFLVLYKEIGEAISASATWARKEGRKRGRKGERKEGRISPNHYHHQGLRRRPPNRPLQFVRSTTCWHQSSFVRRYGFIIWWSCDPSILSFDIGCKGQPLQHQNCISDYSWHMAFISRLACPGAVVWMSIQFDMLYFYLVLSGTREPLRPSVICNNAAPRQ